MLREWATVVAWHEGIATLRCNQQSGCSGCQSRKVCGMGILSEIKPDNVIEFKVPIKQEVHIGQRVEIGIPESSLLTSALLIYCVPLLGLFVGALLANWLSGENTIVMLSGLFGGIIGFLLTRYTAKVLETKRHYTHVVLQIALETTTY